MSKRNAYVAAGDYQISCVPDVQAASHRPNLGSLCDLKQPSCRSHIDESMRFGTLCAYQCTREVCALFVRLRGSIACGALHAYHNQSLCPLPRSSSILDRLGRLNGSNTSTCSTQLTSDANCAQPVIDINPSLLCRGQTLNSVHSRRCQQDDTAGHLPRAGHNVWRRDFGSRPLSLVESVPIGFIPIELPFAQRTQHMHAWLTRSDEILALLLGSDQSSSARTDDAKWSSAAIFSGTTQS